MSSSGCLMPRGHLIGLFFWNKNILEWRWRKIMMYNVFISAEKIYGVFPFEFQSMIWDKRFYTIHSPYMCSSVCQVNNITTVYVTWYWLASPWVMGNNTESSVVISSLWNGTTRVDYVLLHCPHIACWQSEQSLHYCIKCGFIVKLQCVSTVKYVILLSI